MKHMNYIIKHIYIEENNKEYCIFVGKNAKGNDEIIKLSHQDNIWMHIDNTSSCHIIINNKGDIIPKKYIRQVGNMFYDYKKHIPPNVNILYTKIKNVKRTNEIGKVLLTKFEKFKL